VSGAHATRASRAAVAIPRPRAGSLLAWTGVAVLTLLVVTLAGWRAHGGRWERVETASMGTQAPVGTLLWVAPVDPADLRVGDLITFHPPGTRATYSHLIRSVNADGTFSTQGAITAPDPWRVPAEDVVGKVVWRWPGIGWLVLAAPVLLLGGAVVGLVCRSVRHRDLRLSVAVVGSALVVAVTLVVYRPLTRADQVSFVPVPGGARATYVSTGLLPLRLTAAGGGSVVLRDGQVGSVVARGTADPGHRRYAVTLRPAVPWTWSIPLVAACFLPVAVSRRPRKLSS